MLEPFALLLAIVVCMAAHKLLSSLILWWKS